MPRLILEEDLIHPAIRDKVANLHVEIVRNVRSAAASNLVLVVGMVGNPHCRRARRMLDAAGVAHHYLEYGSYLNHWRLRNVRSSRFSSDSPKMGQEGNGRVRIGLPPQSASSPEVMTAG